MARTDILESCIRSSISDWLNEHSFRYNFADFTVLEDMLCAALPNHTPVSELKIRIFASITEWCMNYDSDHTFSDWEALADDLQDRCEYRLNQHRQQETVRHAS